jgi:hypothetical protein
MFCEKIQILDDYNLLINEFFVFSAKYCPNSLITWNKQTFTLKLKTPFFENFTFKDYIEKNELKFIQLLTTFNSNLIFGNWTNNEFFVTDVLNINKYYINYEIYSIYLDEMNIKYLHTLGKFTKSSFLENLKNKVFKNENFIIKKYDSQKFYKTNLNKT